METDFFGKFFLVAEGFVINGAGCSFSCSHLEKLGQLSKTNLLTINDQLPLSLSRCPCPIMLRGQVTHHRQHWPSVRYDRWHRSYCTALYYTAVHCTALRCTALHCTALHCTELNCTALLCTATHCIALHCTALHCTALHSNVLHCTALH